MAWEPIVHDKFGDTNVSPAGACDCSFDVSRDTRGAWVVKSLRFLDPSETGERYVGGPLDDFTPALGATVAAAVHAVLDPTTSELTQVVLPDTDGAFRVVSRRDVGHRTARVTVRCLASNLLPDLVDAKVARVADSSGLSERERQVLRLLLRGRGVEDIATMLEIAPRTVKFHQANVLQKLGADSRLDLLRVVL
ncbi:MAG TPA: helix-turn-helix transcriptional regulator [Polyangiaceae bacterium]|jgi:DNA-binding CsgD family transcriptional regulator|nr:helix-turn-helix transcriptional regulator [Polyangiaceae bacterium]